MTPLHLERADTIERAALAALFTETFTGYFVPTHLDEAALAFMVRAFDIDVSRSVIGREGERAVAMGLLAIRGTRGWVGGMGVVPDARRRGHGREIMHALIGHAREARLRTLDLEVLVQNGSAEALYASLGFQRVRVLDIWRRGPARIPEAAAPTDAVTPIALDAALDFAERWDPEPAPWQRETRTIVQAGFAFEANAMGRDGEPVATLVHRVADGRCSLVALGAATAADAGAIEPLLRHALAGATEASVQLLNLPEGHPAGAVLARLGLAVELQQIEMRLAV